MSEASEGGTPEGIRIYVDADACPVKDEVYKVALRHQLPVFVVANSFMRVPAHALFTRITAEVRLMNPQTFFNDLCHRQSG